jgi:hypothetical protein
MQGVGAPLAGGVAELTSPAIGITVMAATSVAVTLALARGLRPTATAATSQHAACGSRVRREDVGDASAAEGGGADRLDR